MKKWKQLYSIDGFFTCPYCLNVFPISEATKDHKNPFARSKNKSPNNIEIVCKTCNNRKGMLTLDEYKLWSLLEKVRNGDKTIDLIQNLEYIMYILSKQHYKGRYL